ETSIGRIAHRRITDSANEPDPLTGCECGNKGNVRPGLSRSEGPRPRGVRAQANSEFSATAHQPLLGGREHLFSFLCLPYIHAGIRLPWGLFLPRLLGARRWLPVVVCLFQQ
ncbi:hypothetical protein ACFFPI_16940, partial [Arthrobacter methylotrophus]